VGMCSAAYIGGNPEFEKIGKNIRNVFDSVIRFLSDILIHSITNCAPTGPSLVTRPSQSEFSDLTKLSAFEIADRVIRGRKVGAAVLKETMAYLRCFASSGNLDMRNSGVKLLKSFMTSMQRECENLEESEYENENKTMRKRLFNLNLWLCTAVLLEFVTLPPVQPDVARGRSGPDGSPSREDLRKDIPSSPISSLAYVMNDDEVVESNIDDLNQGDDVKDESDSASYGSDYLETLWDLIDSILLGAVALTLVLSLH
jgi:hypothetical protein